MHRRGLLIPLLVGAMALAGCGDGDDDGVGEGQTEVEGAGTASPTGTPTERPTAGPTDTTSPTATPSPTATAEAEFVSAEQDVILGPQEPVTIHPGERQEFSVLGDDVPEQLDISLLPCDNVSFEGSGVSVLAREGEAVDLGETDSDALRIVSVNGEEVEPTTYVNEADATDEPGSQDPAVSFEVTGDEADCAAPVVFQDTDGDDSFDVEGEPFSAGKVTVAG